MKKLISIGLVVCSALVSRGAAIQNNVYSFINSGIRSITITNAAAAPLGGLTNIASWSYSAIDPAITPGTNSIKLTWTNSSGNWVIPTNAATLPTNPSGIQFVTPTNGAQLLSDVLLPVSQTGAPLWGIYPGFATNSTFPGSASVALAEPAMISQVKLTAKIVGDASAANTLNLIFVGVPDGTNDASSSLTVGGFPSFQWGITAAAGTTVIETNLPIWRFAGCKSIRLRSGALTTTTAANIGVALTQLTLTGPYQ